MSSLWVKFQPSSTPPTERFWWGVVLVLVLVLLVLLVLLVTGVKQRQLLFLRLSLEFDKILSSYFSLEWGGVFGDLKNNFPKEEEYYINLNLILFLISSWRRKRKYFLLLILWRWGGGPLRLIKYFSSSSFLRKKIKRNIFSWGLWRFK